MTQTTKAVAHSVLVPLSPEAAFELFTDRFGDWWPRDSHHISDTPTAIGILEPREGGRWYERAEDGSECDWGHVRELERPERLLLAWQLTPEWKFDPDPAKATEVEVTSPRRTTAPGSRSSTEASRCTATQAPECASR
jgi:Activator of Hsp90 ATPase homolog 1-like protein